MRTKKQTYIVNTALILASATLLSGCVTTTAQSNAATRQNMRQREELRQAREMVQRANGDIETLQMEIDRLNQELAQLNQLRSSDFAALESQVQQLRAKQEQDKKEIVAVLSKKVEQLLKSAAPAPSSSSNHGSEYGIEHVVRGGETLSAIAKAYGVSARTIINTNKIKNPNRLTVGQKLFIPQ